MKIIRIFFHLLIIIIILCGCARKQTSNCKPILFPYSEYSYKAEPAELKETYKPDSKRETIDFFGIKIEVPKTWRYEKRAGGRTIKFWTDKDNSFILVFNKAKTINYNPDHINLIGCDNYSQKKALPSKTNKDFWFDIFLLTDQDIKGEPDFWQYLILWSKTQFLHDATKLIHYKGKNIEAFQRNIQPMHCGRKNRRVHIAIFPETIAPNYLTLASQYNYKGFFKDFLEMLNTLNP